MTLFRDNLRGHFQDINVGENINTLEIRNVFRPFRLFTICFGNRFQRIGIEEKNETSTWTIRKPKY